MEGLTVLEVKYDAFLPELIRMAVQVPNRRAAACSKYASAAATTDRERLSQREKERLV